MSHLDPVSLARLQFAATALYDFLFVLLTLAAIAFHALRGVITAGLVEKNSKALY